LAQRVSLFFRHESTMKLWTFHPTTFNVLNASRIDYALGQYWNMTDDYKKQRYRAMLPLLHERLQTDQVLWCDTVSDAKHHSTEIDEIGWELTVPASQIAAFYHVWEWEFILWELGGEWEKLFLKSAPTNGTFEVGALVRFPLESQWVRCLGKPSPGMAPYDINASMECWKKVRCQVE
jgi:hypothetical protein